MTRVFFCQNLGAPCVVLGYKSQKHITFKFLLRTIRIL
jgi:hypothetical protein